MKTNFKVIFAFIIAFMFITVSTTSAQCTSKEEKVVTNIDQVKDFMKFKDKSPIKDVDGHGVIGFRYTESIGKGHRRSGGCCQFNRGLCGWLSSFDLTTDKEGNITSSSFKMYIGESPEGPYVRFEGVKMEDDI